MEEPMAGLRPSSNPLEVQFYFPTLDVIPDTISAMLSTLAHVPQSDQIKHVITVRDRAYQSHPYPCLGRFRFLDLDLSSHPLYASYILPTLTSTSTADGDDAIFLDLGCCLGQDLRKLVYDGAPVSRLYGADLQPEFIDHGYELWRDEDKFPRDHFIAPADVFDTSSNALQQLDGKVSILYVSAVFHLFKLEEQVAIARRCLKLLKKPRDPRQRALICGSQMANETAGEYNEPPLGKNMKFRHTEQSWKDMWERVAGELEWKDQIKAIEAVSVLHKKSRGNANMDKVAGFTPVQDAAGLDAKQRQIGHVAQGFRWMVFSVWVDFS